jgi:Amt family ammonium transporter
VYDYVADKVGEYSIGTQVAIQTEAVITTIILSAVVSVIALFIVKLVVGLRVSEEEEREGLDVSSHGEKAYYL